MAQVAEQSGKRRPIPPISSTPRIGAGVTGGQGTSADPEELAAALRGVPGIGSLLEAITLPLRDPATYFLAGKFGQERSPENDAKALKARQSSEALSGLFGRGFFAPQGVPRAALTGVRGAAAVADEIPTALESSIGKAAPGAGAFASRQAPRVVAGSRAVKPGFAKTAEDLITERGGRAPEVAAAPTSPIQSRIKDLDAYELGFRPDKTDPDIVDLVVKSAQKEIDQTGNIAAYKQRRGVIPVQQTINELSDQTGLTPESITRSKAGTAFNAEELVEVNRTMKSTAARLGQIQSQMTSLQPTLENAGMRQALEIKSLAATAELARLRQVFSGGRAEAGRSMNILKYLRDVERSPNPMLAYERALDAIGGRKNAAEYMKRLNAIWTDPNLTEQKKLLSTFRFAQKIDEPGFFDKIHEFWLNGILSHPVTHEINIISNTALAAAQVPTKYLAASADLVTSGFGKLREREVFFSEGHALAFGMLRGFMPGVKRAMFTMRHGFQQDDVSKFVETGRRVRGQALEGSAGAALNTPTRLLGAEDAVFRGMGKSAGLYAEAARIASKENRGMLSGDWPRRVAELIASPTEPMLAKADDFADYITLQSKPGPRTQAIMDMRNRTGFLKYIIPFIQTPTNLFKRGFEYSPLGVTRALVEKDPIERANAIGRGFLGSAVMAAFVTQFAGGSMTGATPKDPAARDEFFRSGKRPYAIRLGEDWVEFRRFEPLATPLYVLAAALDAAQSAQIKGDGFDVIANKMSAAMARALLDASYLNGLSRLVDAIEDPAESGERVATTITRGFVPYAGFTRGLSETQDPFLRNPDGLWDEIMSGIPGLRETVAVRRDVFGRPVTRPESKRGVGALVNPLVISSVVYDAVDEQLKTIRRPTHYDEKGQPLPAQPFAIGFTGDEVRGFALGPEAAERLQVIAGTETYSRLSQLFTDQLPYKGQPFSALSDADKYRAAVKARDDSRDYAKSVLGDELMAVAQNPAEIFRAASVKLSVIGPRAEKSLYLFALSQNGKLPPEVALRLDTVKGQADPTTSEFVQIGRLVGEYKATPKWTPGIVSPAEEQSIEVNVKRYKELIRGKSSDEIKASAQLSKFYYESAGGLLSYLYTITGSRKTKYVHPRRLEIEADPLWKRYSLSVE